jgi:uncharacterized protein
MSWSLAVGAGAGVFSTLHCAAMCGPLAASQGQRSGSSAGLRYLLGRTTAYGLLGGFAGGTGRALGSVGGPLVGLLFSASLAAGLLLLAARLWRRPVDPPAIGFGRRRRPLVARLVSSLRPGPAGIGALTALLPCGALWAALALAAGSGGAIAGALAMTGFAAASSVGLVAGGWLGAVLRRRSTASRRALAVLMIAGAVIVAMRPLGARDGLPACHRDAAGAAR